ncbi:sorting nexin-11 isoform X4 [Pleurodeles waltl]|uniref:sorting nexin-11 isoform X4 n=1 Tax=Pleurodeles waltl TaxID=8319 RepID=UPI003709B37F
MTNSKAFTAKTSCVRRRYREFVWLRKQLQKNAGLVPVPPLPGKGTFFMGNNEDFIEKRRQGLQQFLEQTVHSMVLLSDSQLHLFLQSQLPLPEIEACVQGRGPPVINVILSYAISNQGWVQEEEETMSRTSHLSSHFTTRPIHSEFIYGILTSDEHPMAENASTGHKGHTSGMTHLGNIL